MNDVTTLAYYTRTARKRHRCGLCLGIIECGETYGEQRNVCDGSAYTWRQHQRCRDFANRMLRRDPYAETIDEWWFEECVNEYPDIAAELGVTFHSWTTDEGGGQ